MPNFTITEENLITQSDGTKVLPEIPADTTSLKIIDCADLNSLPQNLPARLKYLELRRCTSLTSLPELPASLEILELRHCTSLTSLPELPASLKVLDLYRCPSLTSLTNLPDHLEDLYLSHCPSLTSLPELPASLNELNLFGCTSLQPTPELLARLESLEIEGGRVGYPQHFNFSSQAQAAEEKLEAAIESYMNPRNGELVNESNSSSNGSSSSSSNSSLKLSSSSSSNSAPKPRPAAIKTLLHRFLTESVGQRGSSQATNSSQALSELVATTTPVLDVFTKNPNHLEIAEEIAKAYAVDGCINQPVAGWLEISAIMSIAMAPETADKIAATKHLRALETIKNYVATLAQDQKPGSNVEVEAGNALFREVHKKLLENQEIENPWLAVPNSIAYELAIRNWLTEEKINQAYQQTSQILAQTPQQVANYLCEGIHQETWAQIAFPNKINQIKNSYEKEMEFLDAAIEKQSQSQSSQSRLSQSQPIKFNDLNLNPKIDEPTTQLLAAKYFNEDGNLKSLPELQDLYQNLPKMRAQEIATKVKELTFEAIESSLNLNPQKTQQVQTHQSQTQQAQTQQAQTQQAQTRAPEVVEVTSCSPLGQILRNMNPFSRG